MNRYGVRYDRKLTGVESGLQGRKTVVLQHVEKGLRSNKTVAVWGRDRLVETYRLAGIVQPKEEDFGVLVQKACPMLINS